LGRPKGVPLGRPRGLALGRPKALDSHWGSPTENIFIEKPKEHIWKTIVFYDDPESSKLSAAVQATSPQAKVWFQGEWLLPPQQWYGHYQEK